MTVELGRGPMRVARRGEFAQFVRINVVAAWIELGQPLFVSVTPPRGRHAGVKRLPGGAHPRDQPHGAVDSSAWSAGRCRHAWTERAEMTGQQQRRILPRGNQAFSQDPGIDRA
ncbi:hypothetical protein VFPBJ_06677 [Purpureocillium lilacinum]|uniref:Uncharacterized protein n=1 Tax=Purpureocillium lilacinum TaxID=33203 RepID=A0A179GKY9_PURLI|nr:hypothetical protein VFPBJ_06677 [Purpureocillium lilacinum]